MSDYIKKILVNNTNVVKKTENNEINEINEINENNEINEINEIKEIISTEMIKKQEKNMEEFIKKNFEINYESFIIGIEKKIITLDMILKFIEIKPNKKEKIEIYAEICKKLVDEIKNKGFINYTDETIDNFIRYFILSLDLELDILCNETSISYLKRILNLYNINLNIKLLKNKISSRYYIDVLKLHSLIKSKKMYIDKNIKEKFIDFLEKLYFDRDSGYEKESLDLENENSTNNLDINTLYQNRKYQVNFYSFMEEQETPNYKIRTDLKVIKELLEIGKIFNLIGHNVVIIGSEFEKDLNGQGLWKNRPYKFDEIYEKIIKNYPKLLFAAINIYLIVDFECM